MVPIVVKETPNSKRCNNMSESLMNIVKILVVLFVCLFVYNTAFGKTITMNVDGKELIKITVSEEMTPEETRLKNQRKNPIASNTHTTIVLHYSQCLCHENYHIRDDVCGK